MNRTRITRLLSFILCVALIAAIALTTVGCDKTTPEAPETNGSSATATTEAGTKTETPDPNAPTVKGEGATTFYFNVVDKDGNETKFEIHTDKTTVGEALLELGLIEGDMGDYGLYVKKVNGITADYDVDGTYWAFYVGNEYGMTGVDMTDIEPGATYAFKVSK
ncbi:MAG: DUF4430 domain-containing protein [Clostridia bacterium]|nr:DUF4430 domain-containing protein [Clostridia bacterium]